MILLHLLNFRIVIEIGSASPKFGYELFVLGRGEP